MIQNTRLSEFSKPSIIFRSKSPNVIRKAKDILYIIFAEKEISYSPTKSCFSKLTPNITKVIIMKKKINV